MTTVPGPETPAPADNHMTFTVSDAKSHDYGRPTAGGNAAGGAPEGGSSNAPPGSAPGYAVDMDGEPASTGGTQTASATFSGATLIVPQPDATGLPAGDASGGGTVGDSGSQAPPGPIPILPDRT